MIIRDYDDFCSEKSSDHKAAVEAEIPQDPTLKQEFAKIRNN